MRCPECGERILDDVCIGCGLVIDDRPIIRGIVSYDEGDERKDPEKSISYISWDDPDIGFKTYHSNKTKNKRLKFAFKTEKKTQKKQIFGISYLNGKNEIERICNNMGLSKTVTDDAIRYLRILTIDGSIQKSYKKYATYAALVVISARFLTRLPISFAEIAQHTNENIKSIKKAYQKLRKELKIAHNPFYLEEVVAYHCNLLGIVNNEQKKCIDYAKKIKITTGRIPYGYSAAVIRIITRRSRRELSRVLKVSEPVITARERELRKNAI